MRREPPATFTRTPDVVAVAEPKQFDPLQLCIYTTIGIISWLITPALTVAVFGTLGVVGYLQARRRGQAKSRCKLGDTRLVIAYLAIAATVGAAVTIVSVVRFLS
jgi:hypothetical protein